MESSQPHTGESTESGRREEARKQQEIINRVLAGSIVTQLLQSGCDEGQVIDFATEVLHSVAVRGWNRDGGSAPGASSPQEVRDILCRVASEDARPSLEGTHVCMRPLRAEHHDVLRHWREQPHVQRTCSHKLLGDLLEAKDQEEERYDLVLSDRSGDPFGLVSLFHIQRGTRQAEIAKLIGNPDARGHGYAHEATCLMLAYAFQHLGLQRVYLRTNGFNLHNIKLNEKIGFRFEGILRASEMLNQELIDVVLMSMLGREFYCLYRISDLSQAASSPE